MFHSKLFLATEGSATRALVGSANATGAAFTRNEELLVALEDPGALSEYYEAAWQNASELDDLDVRVQSLIAFFRTGVLYFKPVVALSTTINPFRELFKLMTSSERAALGGVVLPHADQDAGIGAFNLKLALLKTDAFEDVEDLSEVADEEPGGANRASIKPWSVETCFGYWVPAALDGEWNRRLDEASARKRRRWAKLREDLDQVPREALLQRYREYLTAAKKVLYDIPTVPAYIKRLKRDPFQETYFESFLERVVRYLQDDTRLDRLARPFTSGAVPEIWDDAGAYDDFTLTYFEYLDQAARLGPNSPRVPRLILDKINSDESAGPDSLRTAFEEYLQEEGWPDENWD